MKRPARTVARTLFPAAAVLAGVFLLSAGALTERPMSAWASGADTVAADPENGPVETYYPDGKLRTRARYHGGDLEGTYERYGPDGHLEEIRTYHKDRLNGPAKRFAPDGRLLEEVGYRDGLLSGPHVIYGPDGQRFLEAVYERGHPKDDASQI